MQSSRRNPRALAGVERFLSFKTRETKLVYHYQVSNNLNQFDVENLQEKVDTDNLSNVVKGALKLNTFTHFFTNISNWVRCVTALKEKWKIQ